jgi:hypothetical protein
MDRRDEDRRDREARDEDRPTVERRKRASRATELRIPSLSASLPVTAIYVTPGEFAEMGLEVNVGRLLSAADEGQDPPAVVLREEYAEMVIRGAKALRDAGPEYAGRPVPTPEDFVGKEVEVAGKKAVVVGIAGQRPVTRGVLREGFGEETSLVYFLGSVR